MIVTWDGMKNDRDDKKQTKFLVLGTCAVSSSAIIVCNYLTNLNLYYLFFVLSAF